MRTALLALAIFGFALTSQARIGETPDQCAARYGKPVTVKGGIYIYKKAGLILSISFFEGMAESVTFCKAEQNALKHPVELSDNEVQQLLTANAGTKVWRKTSEISMNRSWQTEDGELTAQYVTLENYLVILTKGCVARFNAKKAADENANLKEF